MEVTIYNDKGDLKKQMNGVEGSHIEKVQKNSEDDK